jgi:gamma-glutamyltranspeptidase
MRTLARRGMVASPHFLATAAGLRILREGGTAVDAAIATNAVLAVVTPYMCGIGGDLFAQVYWRSGRTRHEPVPTPTVPASVTRHSLLATRYSPPRPCPAPASLRGPAGFERPPGSLPDDRASRCPEWEA